MQTHTASKPAQTSVSVPLARDEHGNSIAVPAEAAFWRVRRHTRGRPRNIAGVDREPLKLPLDFTEDDVHNMLGDGTYRLDLCNQDGESLDLTVAVAVGDQEPNHGNASAAEPAVSLLPATASDIRLVLEANVRATQMAFHHNERTLAASLRMADTLRDGIRDLASAQASWITSISSARGFFRNAPPLQLPVPERPHEDDDDDDDEDDEREESEPGFDWVTTLQPIVGMVTQQAVTAIMGVITKSGGGSDLIANALDWRRAAEKRDAKPPIAHISTPSALTESKQADPKSLPDMLVDKAIAISAFLQPAEQSRLMALMPTLMKRANDPDLLKLVSELVPLSPADGAIWIRSHVDEIEQRFGS